MGEIKFERKTLVEAINTTLQETEQTAAEQSVAHPWWPVSRSLGRRRKRHSTGAITVLCRVFGIFWVIHPLGGWMSNRLHQSQRTQGS